MPTPAALIGALIGRAAGTGVVLTNTGNEVDLAAGVTDELTRPVHLNALR